MKRGDIYLLSLDPTDHALFECLQFGLQTLDLPGPLRSSAIKTIF
jgi:hypothetical protein